MYQCWRLIFFRPATMITDGGGRQAVKTGTGFPPPKQGRRSWRQRSSSEPFVAIILLSFMTASSSQTARLPQRDWQSIPQSWGTYKAYLKIEAYKNYTSNPQKGGRQGLYWYQIWTHQSWIDWLWKPINQFIILNYWSCAVTYEAPPDACEHSSTTFNLEH